VWIPKFRSNIIDGWLRKDVEPILRWLGHFRGAGILEGKAYLDHIHLFLHIPLMQAVATIVWYLKGKGTEIM